MSVGGRYALLPALTAKLQS